MREKKEETIIQAPNIIQTENKPEKKDENEENEHDNEGSIDSRTRIASVEELLSLLTNEIKGMFIIIYVILLYINYLLFCDYVNVIIYLRSI